MCVCLAGDTSEFQDATTQVSADCLLEHTFTILRLWLHKSPGETNNRLSLAENGSTAKHGPSDRLDSLWIHSCRALLLRPQEVYCHF